MLCNFENKDDVEDFAVDFAEVGLSHLYTEDCSYSSCVSTLIVSGGVSPLFWSSLGL